MSSYIIEGGKKLQGETYVTGSKNASLPIMAASLLNKGITKLYNVPNIHDTQMMIEILKSLGLMHQMRSSVIFAGAILGRYKKATFSYPGDCDIWWIHRTSLR